MKTRMMAGLVGLAWFLVWDSSALAQREKKDEEFLKEAPRVGEALPDLTIFTAEGKEWSTRELKGQYTVLTFGCLT